MVTEKSFIFHKHPSPQPKPKDDEQGQCDFDKDHDEVDTMKMKPDWCEVNGTSITEHALYTDFILRFDSFRTAVLS